MVEWKLINFCIHSFHLNTIDFERLKSQSVYGAILSATLTQEVTWLNSAALNCCAVCMGQNDNGHLPDP